MVDDDEQTRKGSYSQTIIHDDYKMTTNLDRRTFLQSTTGALIAGATLEVGANNVVVNPIRAKRPEPPYRIWFQPRLFIRDVDLYANMTIDASGWIDPRIAAKFGKATLDWVYGLNHPYADGPGYWRESGSNAARSRPTEQSQIISAGIAVDEWVPPHKPDNVEWLAEGLRAGRKANPDVFIALSSTDPTPPLIELAKEGTVDLVLVEGYTHSVEPGLTTSWDGALRRHDMFADAGLSKKTVFSFGHITAKEDSRGGFLQPKWLAERAAELKQRYPEMPGIAYFQSTDDDSPELRELVRICDQLSGELWPDEPNR